MKTKNIATGLTMLVVLVMVLGEVKETEAATCDPTELSSCSLAITLNINPSDTCCTKIKEQEPCLCEYKNNPTFEDFINSPGAQKISKACNVSFPTTC